MHPLALVGEWQKALENMNGRENNNFRFKGFRGVNIFSVSKS